MSKEKNQITTELEGLIYNDYNGRVEEQITCSSAIS